MTGFYAETFVGVPCSKCGGTERYASTHNCVACQRVRAARAVASGKAKASTAKYRENAANLQRGRDSATAYRRALQRLALAHPSEFHDYVDEERERMDLPPSVNPY